MSVIPASRRRKQEGQKFKVIKAGLDARLFSIKKDWERTQTYKPPSSMSLSPRLHLLPLFTLQVSLPGLT